MKFWIVNFSDRWGVYTYVVAAESAESAASIVYAAAPKSDVCDDCVKIEDVHECYDCSVRADRAGIVYRFFDCD